MIEMDVEYLEAYLDGELPAEDVNILRGRLAHEPELAAELEQLFQERSLRGSLFASFEADADDRAVERVMARVHGKAQNPRRHVWLAHAMRLSGAAAACLAVGFLAGWLGRSRPNVAQQPAPAVSHAQLTYDVAVRDDSGTVMGVQKFTSFEEAQEFREDLQRWQQRQEQLRSGQVTVRSAQF